MPRALLRPTPARTSLRTLEGLVKRLQADLDAASEPRDVAALSKALLDALRARDEAKAAAPLPRDPVSELQRRRSG